MNAIPSFATITTFVFDMDGVLTDGTLLLLSDQLPLRRMHIKDGYALQLAVKKGYSVYVISGSESVPAKERLHKLGIQSVWMNVSDKKALFNQILEKEGLNKQEVLYMGDDMPDYSVMQDAGLPCCPADAAEEIKQISRYVSAFNGGTGCVRDVIERVLRARGDWSQLDTVSSR